jgi:cyclophilin family peptidyl-prolyl cis-trans isomerase/HEAT repeat protein
MSRDARAINGHEMYDAGVLRRIAFVATVLACGCPSGGPGPAPPHVADDTALRVRVANAEARRAGGVAELGELAVHGDAHARVLALRGLGRIGGPAALGIVERALGDRDRGVRGAAIAALGVAASLDDPQPIENATQMILAAMDGNEAIAIEALGRAGDASAQPALVAALGNPRLAEVAALALGRHGRRTIALSPEARAALVTATRHPDERVRFAAVYALGREHEPPSDEAVLGALVERLDDEAPVRAQAIAALAKRKATHSDKLLTMLLDRDWRVGVEAVRALAATEITVVADAVGAGWDRLPPQVLDEGLRKLATRPPSSELPATTLEKYAPMMTGKLQCLVAAARRRPVPEIATACPGAELAILGDMIASGSLDEPWKRAAVRALLENSDPRVRAAGIGAAPSVDEKLAASTTAAALASKDPVIAGAALDAIGDHFTGDAGLATVIDRAIVERAARETDLELSSDLYGLIGKRHISAGADACRAGLTGHPVRARAAAECLRQLGEAVPVPPIGDATPPPVDVASVIGKKVLWHLSTTQGAIDIELLPDVAPWNVATVVSLTKRGFYDGLAFHRVVYDFVVQGGDPTQSGWGGPGFTTPAEPASLADGVAFVEGGVGIADAGRDSGGSQYFIMHAAAPHLDGRYTQIGRVVDGQKSADAMRIGDRVLRATVELR